MPGAAAFVAGAAAPVLTEHRMREGEGRTEWMR